MLPFFPMHRLYASVSMRIYFYFPLGISYTLKLIAIASTAAVDGDRAKELITDDDDDDILCASTRGAEQT